MSDKTACVATKEECSLNCMRRHLKLNPYNQSYANFALDYKDDKGNCMAFLSFNPAKRKVLVE